MLASLGSKGKNRNCLACLGNAGSYSAESYCIWIPGDKIAPGGNLQYENQGSQTKFFDYHAIIYAYANYTTSQFVGHKVGIINDAFVKLYYKDA